LGEAYRLMVAGNRRGGGPEMRQALMRFRQAREEARQPLLDRWPDLRQRNAAGFAAARTEALSDLARRVQDGRLRELFAADEALDKAEEQQFQTEIMDARVLRLVRLAKSVILAHRLRDSGDAAARQRFERLITAEARPLLQPAAVAARPLGSEQVKR
jgi:hypothetical protein